MKLAQMYYFSLLSNSRVQLYNEAAISKIVAKFVKAIKNHHEIRYANVITFLVRKILIENVL